MKWKFIAAIICVVVVCAGVLWFRHQRVLANRYNCLSALRSIGWGLSLYCENSRGRLPEDLSLISDVGGSPRVFLCPWDNKPAGSWTNITEWMDYFYVYWPSRIGVYTNYPLMYDRRLANHGGKGINVLLVEQTIHPAAPNFPESYHGQFFWDEGGKWLKKFAKEHPHIHIPMPDGLH